MLAFRKLFELSCSLYLTINKQTEFERTFVDVFVTDVVMEKGLNFCIKSKTVRKLGQGSTAGN